MNRIVPLSHGVLSVGYRARTWPPEATDERGALQMGLATKRLAALAAVGSLTLLGAAPQAQAHRAEHGHGERRPMAVVQRSVSFKVRNVNRSKIRCAADGKTYTVRGHVTGPKSAFEHPGAVTLFLHGLSYGEFFGNFEAQPGYNFARKQARAGHVTATVDRLGYDSSDKPVGTGICFGSRADIAHQIVLQLRSGHYRSDERHDRSSAFSKVVLAGHSVGAIIAQAEAYSFGDIDGLMVLSYSDTTVSAAAQKALKVAVAQCKAGGERSGGTTGPGGYVYFGAATPQQFIAAHFFTPNADPSVVRATAKMRNRDPCGDITSYNKAVVADFDNLYRIHVPVLVLIGTKDAIYPTRAADQASLLTGSHDVTTVNIARTGHALTLHYSRNEFSDAVSRWLSRHHFGDHHDER